MVNFGLNHLNILDEHIIIMQTLNIVTFISCVNIIIVNYRIYIRSCVIV